MNNDVIRIGLNCIRRGSQCLFNTLGIMACVAGVLPVSGFDSPQPSDDLVFLHHSCGSNWLDAGLNDALLAKDYVDERNDIGYGTTMSPDSGRPSSLGDTPGDNTDMNHWILWFNDYLGGIKTHGCASGVNRIVMFKSCYPASHVESDGSEPGDPFSGTPSLANYRAVFRHPSGLGNTYQRDGHAYRALNDVFGASPDTLFVVVTAPPLHYGPSDPSSEAAARRARVFNQWLKTEWLREYNNAYPQHRNVMVFDWFDVIANPDDHMSHPNRLRMEYGGNSGDSHPNNAACVYSVDVFATGDRNALDQAWASFTRPSGRVVNVNTVSALRTAINTAQSNDTILIADGSYQNGSPLVLNNVNNVTLRSASGNASAVTLLGRTAFSAGGNYDELDDILRIRTCSGVYVEGITFSEAHGYGIKLELDSTANPNGIHISDCRFINIGTRHIKGTRDPADDTKRIRGGSVRCCYFENTVVPPASGGWHANGDYVAGIDAMCLADWVFEDNEFRGIRGRNAVGRSAIFVWHFSEGITIQRNRIINGDRGITLGLSGDISGYHVNGAIVRNNFIKLRSLDGLSSDSGIECWTVNNIRIYNNSVWRSENPNGRGIRFIANVHNTQMVNNLVRGRLVFDGGISISRNENNLSGDLDAGMFLNPDTCDLRLTPQSQSALNAGLVLSEVKDDFGLNPRDLTPNIGASEEVVSSQSGGDGVNEIRSRYVPVVDAQMKATLRQIRLRGMAKGRAVGVLGQWGDSITNSQAYLGSLASWGMISVPPSNGHDYGPILLWMGASPGGDQNPLRLFKGGNYCNDSGWTVPAGLSALDDAINRANPSWSLTMFGTNDIRRNEWNPEAYRTLLTRFIQANIEEGIVPVLSTIPPCVGYDTNVGQANTVVREVGGTMGIPVVDLHGLFMDLHPDDWSSVLLSDGVHPSHSYGSGDLSDDSLRNDGYNIRSVLTLDIAEKLKRIIFDNGVAEGGESAPIVSVSSSSHPYLDLNFGMQVSVHMAHESGPTPDGYSWVMDSSPFTMPDTTVEGTSSSVVISAPSAGDWFFHVRARSGNAWGPVVHLPVAVCAHPTVRIQRRSVNQLMVADSFISQHWGGDDNFGGSSVFNLYNSSSARESRGLYRFDLSGQQASGVTRALFVLNTNLPLPTNIRWELYPIAGSWVEGSGNGNNDASGVRWNDGLSVDSSAIASGTLNAGESSLVVDVTDTVRSWLQGARPNHGLMLQHLEVWRSFEPIGSEYGAVGLRPCLLIEYGSTNAAPVLVPIGSRTVPVGQQIQFTVQGNDADGESLQFRATGGIDL